MKPANIVFVQGEPCVGDYGLVGEPGSAFAFGGTEGFQPVEGTSDVAADLFALGKTLYEAWTALDRLEFPSLPRAVLDAPDWNTRGGHLNEVLLRACHAQPARRFHSANEFAMALTHVVSGERPINRRRWLALAAGGAGLAAGAAVLSRLWRAPGRLIWWRVRQQGFEAELWQGHAGTADWPRRRLYSLAVDNRGCVFEWVDLDHFTLTAALVPDGPKSGDSTILHPETRQLWAVEGGHGEVFALGPESLKVTRLGGGPETGRHYGARTYWNPITRRVGIFGGYGQFSVRNDRSEFDAAAGRWVELEPDRRNTDLWPRTMSLPLVPDDTGRRLFVVGGSGSPSGKEGDEVPGLRAFNGQFHTLDDIWELDLQTNSWRQLLPVGHLEPARLKAAVYSRRLQGLVIFEGMQLGSDESSLPSAWLLRANRDRLPRKLAMAGQLSRLARLWAWTLDPQKDELLLFADDGIFRVAFEPG